MFVRRFIPFLFAFALITRPASLHAQQARITVDAANVLNKIPATLYGSCTEDVNHEIYGGLYGQRLFGESFEEPAPAPAFEDWTQLPGAWRVGGDGNPRAAGPGFQLIYNNILVSDGSIEAHLQFVDRARSAGILLRVNNIFPGNPTPTAYAVEVSRGRNRVFLKKYGHAWQDLAQSNNELEIKDSVLLHVSVKGKRINVYANDLQHPLIEYTDTAEPILTGQVGIYANNDAALFSDIKVTVNDATNAVPLQPATATQVSLPWTPVTSNASVVYQLDTANAYTGRQSQLIQFISGKGRAGVANSGLNHWGIAVKSGERFNGSVYLRAASFGGTVTIALESADGKLTYATAQLPKVSADWKKYTFSLTSTQTVSNTRLVIYMAETGKLWIDQATLMGTNAGKFRGLPFREDIGVMMQQQGLNFLRYGGTMVNAPQYKWKNMTGAADQRPPYKGHWYPYGSNGFGIEEFLQFCERAGFEPAFAINVEDPAQDIADMVEYLTGNESSPEGKKRAAAGHPQPYKLRYIEIGNEEVIWGDNKNDYQHYADRFNILYNVIHAKNPAINLVCAAWWRPASPNMELVFNAINGRAAYWDLHTDADEANAGTTVDRNLQNMQDLFKKWDPHSTLKCTIFEENGGLHNLQRALGHATTLNAVRRHGDFVLTSCPANALQPYLQNDNDWDQGQIFFTPSQVWFMPPFYAQQMAAQNHLGSRIDAQIEGPLDVTATRSDNGKTVVMHVINTGSKSIPCNITCNNFPGKHNQVITTTLAGNLNDVNTPLAPENSKPVKGKLQMKHNEFSYAFPPFSYTILSVGGSSPGRLQEGR